MELKILEIKDTLNLLKTKFPMRAGLANKEPMRQEEWEQQNIYEQRRKLNEGKPKFILHDGPPFANGPAHMGHALNKVTKDFIVRYRSMSGFDAPFVHGWDTHGLPVEQALTNQGVDRKTMSIVDFRKLSEEYALGQIDIQREAFKRLGVTGEIDAPYITLLPEYEAAQIRVFGKMAEKGYIYQGKKPVYWSPSSESTLAEAEIEYHDVRGPSIYVAFPVKDGKGVVDTDAKFVIWTTTPWTLPSNLAIAVHEQGIYNMVQVGDEKYIVGADLLGKLSEKLGWEDVEVLKEIKGKELEYVTAQHPFIDRESLLILGDHVTFEDGTGLVHTAPGHGDEDYIVGQKYKLDVLSPIDDQGHFTNEVPELEGVFYDDANQVITGWLEEKGLLLDLSFFTHSYPHDWRTKKPVIFRATPQWFASIDDFRQNILEEIDNVEWLLPSGKPRIYNMVRDRGDWVISRQRNWGVPLPIFYAENGDAIITPETIEHVANLFAEHGSTVWYDRDTKDLLPEGFTHEGSPNGEFTKEKDIMDVWFDSGSSHEAVLRQHKDLQFPADLYLEGSDQYRGWFNSSLTTSVAINGVAPYKVVLSQGFVLDGDGRKMSKSIGNVIDPIKVMNQMGADIVRLWVLSTDSSSDVRVSMDLLNQVSEVYRKIRNTLRFLIQNTEDFDPVADSIAYEDLRSIDQYMLNVLDVTVETALDGYENYKFNDIFKVINHFVTVDMSNFYMNIAKDILYIDAPDAYDRRAIQTVFYEVMVKLTKLLSPVIPHTAEEIWEYLKEEEAYVQLTEMPEVVGYANRDEILEKWNAFMDLRDNILKANEVARENKVIGRDFEAKTTLYVTDSVKALFDSLESDLRQILVASELNILSLADRPAEDDSVLDFENMAIKVEHMPGGVCERCRITTEELVHIDEKGDLCHRCHDIVKEHYPELLEAE